jgi:hypothetical protein
MARTYYRIESRDERRGPFMVRAESYDHAAQIGARGLYGRLKGLWATRVTGDAGKSGYSQAYLPVEQNCSSSHGRNFHVQEA